MNEFISSIIVAIVQGLTEWLPVSSSGHLVLVQKLLNFNVGLEFDVVLHLGTLMAVFVYFGKDIVDIAESLLKGKFESEEGRLGIYVLVATIPAGVIGYLFREVFENVFDNLVIVGIGFAVTGIVLFIASINFGRTNADFRKFGYGKSLIVGFAQVFSIFPGVSRSGATLSASLLSGLSEKNALKFSFLMSIPVILGANLLVIGTTKLSPNLIWATLVSFLVGILAIHFLFKVISTNRRNLRWFATYAILLSVLVLSYVVLQ